MLGFLLATFPHHGHHPGGSSDSASGCNYIPRAAMESEGKLGGWLSFRSFHTFFSITQKLKTSDQNRFQIRILKRKIPILK